MSENFYDIFEEYSNLELVKITRNPDHYQAGAVDTAYKILLKRNISEDQLERLNAEYDTLLSITRSQPGRFQKLKRQFIELMRPGAEEGAFAPEKWLKLVLLVFSVYYIISLFRFGSFFIDYINCSDCKPDRMFFTVMMETVGIPIMILLLSRKHTLGWISFYAGTFILFAVKIAEHFTISNYLLFDFHSITMLLLYASLNYLLSRDDFRSIFGATDRLKMRTAIVSTAISLLLIALMIFA